METRKDMLDELELRSESVQDILTRPPHWMLRWGNVLIFVSLLLILLMSYLIKYPEFISAPIVVTSQNPPEKIEARLNSKIEKIWVHDRQNVKKGELLMVLQSAANYKDVLSLKKMMDTTTPNNLYDYPLSLTNQYRLGELQTDYNAFAKALKDQQLFSRLQPYSPEKLAASQSISELMNRMLTLKEQLSLEKAKFDISKKDFQRSQSLFDQGVISKMELDNDKIKLLQAEQNLKNLNLSVSQIQESVNNLKKTKSGVNISAEKDKINYETLAVQQFEQLRKSLIQWEQSYLIISSIEGRVSYQQFWGENQFIKAGDAIVSIIPENKMAVVGRMMVPAINSGKIAEGQKVLIKLDNYRYQEYGMVEGIVKNVSLTPDEKGNYYVEIVLPKGLKTSYNKSLPFDKELKGNADIVTQDLRLLERFFYQLRKLLGHQG